MASLLWLVYAQQRHKKLYFLSINCRSSSGFFTSMTYLLALLAAALAVSLILRLIWPK
jgi:hypothetical protein